MTSSVLALCAWLFQPADALVLDEIVAAAENREPHTHTVEKIVNRELLFSSESRVSMRGQVYNVPRGLVWNYVLGIAERESEEMAPKRERESLGTRERERECSSVVAV